jgi:hypothetical protein
LAAADIKSSLLRSVGWCHQQGFAVSDEPALRRMFLLNCDFEDFDSGSWRQLGVKSRYQLEVSDFGRLIPTIVPGEVADKSK